MASYLRQGVRELRGAPAACTAPETTFELRRGNGENKICLQVCEQQ